jgi:hypothetical protein
MGLPTTVITISVNPIIIVSTPTGITPTATISVIIARTIGTIMIRSQRWEYSARNKLRPAGYLAGLVLSIRDFERALAIREKALRLGDAQRAGHRARQRNFS